MTRSLIMISYNTKHTPTITHTHIHRHTHRQYTHSLTERVRHTYTNTHMETYRQKYTHRLKKWHTYKSDQITHTHTHIDSETHKDRSAEVRKRAHHRVWRCNWTDHVTFDTSWVTSKGPPVIWNLLETGCLSPHMQTISGNVPPRAKLLHKRVYGIWDFLGFFKGF